MDMRIALLELEKRLVDVHGFKKVQLAGTGHITADTAPIVQFLAWLDSTPQAKETLAELNLAK